MLLATDELCGCISSMVQKLAGQQPAPRYIIYVANWTKWSAAIRSSRRAIDASSRRCCRRSLPSTGGAMGAASPHTKACQQRGTLYSRQAPPSPGGKLICFGGGACAARARLFSNKPKCIIRNAGCAQAQPPAAAGPARPHDACSRSQQQLLSCCCTAPAGATCTATRRCPWMQRTRRSRRSGRPQLWGRRRRPRWGRPRS